MKYFLKLMVCVAAFSVAFTSCSSDDSKEESAGFSVKLVDAPGDYQSVMVDVQGIEVIIDGEAHEFAAIEPGVYDLLELTGGISAMLVETVVPTGNLSQIRLILGENNSVITAGADGAAGEEIPLKTPSAQQSGLKLNVHQDLEPGLLYEFILDFNVDKSIVETNDGGLNLKPVISASLEAQSGAIAGVVTPAEVQSFVTATDGTTEFSAYTAEGTGNFMIYGVPAGTYTVTITPAEASGKAPVTVEGVVVETGKIQEMDPVTLE